MTKLVATCDAARSPVCRCVCVVAERTRREDQRDRRYAAAVASRNAAFGVRTPSSNRSQQLQAQQQLTDTNNQGISNSLLLSELLLFAVPLTREPTQAFAWMLVGCDATSVFFAFCCFLFSADVSDGRAFGSRASETPHDDLLPLLLQRETHAKRRWILEGTKHSRFVGTGANVASHT